MKCRIAGALVLGIFVVGATTPSAKGATTKITISGPNLPTPITITEPSILNEFQVWTGPGVVAGGVPETQGFIIDWSSGTVAERPRDIDLYQVSFYSSHERRIPDGGVQTFPETIVYIVLYGRSPANGRGYIYVPTGKDDQAYAVNTSSICRGGLERHWFHATDAWDSVAQRLIAQANR